MTDAPNAAEAAYWSGPSGLSWIRNEAEQDRLLAPVTEIVLHRAGLRPGARVLDIGCGTGALSLAAAAQVGPSGRVLATDISAPLLARAAERGTDLPQMETALADAQTADWGSAGFDAAISRFGVMFFADPPAAFANIARALRPGGRMTFATWGPLAVNPWWSIPRDVAARRLGSPPPSTPNAPGPMGLANSDWALSQFHRAGLEDAACEVATVPLVLADAAAAASLALRIGPAARIVRLFDASPSDAAAIRDEMAEAFEAFADGDGFRLPAVLNLFTATAA